MFADALERAVNSNEQTASDVPGDSGADHPYYDHPELQDDREAAVVTDDACRGVSTGINPAEHNFEEKTNLQIILYYIHDGCHCHNQTYRNEGKIL